MNLGKKKPTTQTATKRPAKRVPLSVVEAAMKATDDRFSGMSRKDIEHMAEVAPTERERGLAKGRLVLMDDGGPVQQIDPAAMDAALRDA